ncbi:TetR/AcrR family transcriptional regulator [Pseudonocardia endophytica]|uniref:TetR family transcriptional regulator n=1 Tax=Pseudonocardia endophytica TaxID=401976 RepID=A0A4R1I2L2_PSEEN|nr:TetR family transcriptional regulator [Pseudonocardia endophytica]TCK26739.1 TetR family transcriptional regulator [Pseudonocardia endophytica]
MSGDTGTGDRRSTIVRAVWRVIAEQGMEAVSMRTVAAAAAVSVGRIQYWFRTKDELLRVSLEAMLSDAAQHHADATEHVEDRAALLHLIGHPIPRAEGAGAGVSLFHQYVAASINHPTLASLLAEAKDGQEREATRLLRTVAPDLRDPRDEARLLVATADGLAMRVLMSSLSATEAQRALRVALDCIIGSESEVPNSPEAGHVAVRSGTA